MNFKILKEIVATLKEKIKCPKCRKEFANREIFTDAITWDQVLLRCVCRKCTKTMLIDVKLMSEPGFAQPLQLEFNRIRSQRSLKVKSKQLVKISHDDILDMKNFLKNFTGDFKKIFKK